MNMFATQGGVVELWVTKIDTYTSTKTGEIYASVQSIAPIPEGARGNAKGFEISEYNIEPTLLDAIVFEGQPVLCKFASVVRPTQDRFGRITNTQVLVDLLAVGGKPMAPTAQAPARPQAQAQAPRPAPQPQGQDKQDKSPDAKA
ncbi:DNA-binding protein [Pseudomonas aeruginosa]|uniref:DNA-binding protein n=1 Tax=Pseudomonas aeruginosa TaxID=287 RepID=UPI001068A6CB|nr:DNA-binding protein [Pseudomonas aeruginosa]TEF28690.1 DNA-binding protein [Pseudomonas aeruginosa]